MTHVQIQLVGSSLNGESWSTSLRYASVLSELGGPEAGMINTGSIPPVVLQNIADGAAEVIQGMTGPTALRQGMSGALSIVGVRASRITTDGTLDLAAEATFATPMVGIGSPNKPYQSSCVISLNVGAMYGRSGRGRVYWPMIGDAAQLSNGLITTEWRDSVLGSFNAFQASLGTIVNEEATQLPSATLVVFSPTRGEVRRVDKLSVDSVPDTQRRRADRLSGTRQTVPRN